MCCDVKCRLLLPLLLVLRWHNVVTSSVAHARRTAMIRHATSGGAHNTSRPPATTTKISTIHMHTIWCQSIARLATWRHWLVARTRDATLRRKRCQTRGRHTLPCTSAWCRRHSGLSYTTLQADQSVLLYDRYMDTIMYHTVLRQYSEKEMKKWVKL